MLRLLGYSVLAAVLLVSCSLQELIQPHSLYPVPAYQNPHTFCGSCHETDSPGSDSALFTPGTDPSESCFGCHDYRENHHPVDFVPPDPARIPFPLFDGRVRCLTCHQIHGGPSHKGTPKLLRGGPYPDRRKICFNCHSGERYAAIDPHKMLDDAGNVRDVDGKPVCLLCHSKVPDPEVDRTNDVRFRADVGFLCWRCHPPMPDPFFRQHFLVKPSAETLKNIQSAEERLMVTLPLVPRGRITCSTCHNPHQKGVIRREGAAKGADATSRLRLSSICFACHRM